MSDARKFRFVSPGIFLSEVDQSQIPALPDLVGPVIIGRSERGPGMIPTKVGSFSEFVEKFGNPIPGRGGTLDVWREGNYASPTYAAYAAQAYLRAGVGPITFMRLMGTQSPSATTAGQAGWTTQNVPSTTLASNGGPYGLFVFASGALFSSTNAGTLAAVWYMDSGSVPVLSGTTVSGVAYEYAGTVLKSDSSGQFKVRILGAGSTELENVTFTLSESSDNFIRKVFNTNPQNVGAAASSTSSKKYWLGETYERCVAEKSLAGVESYGAIMAITSGSSLQGNHERDMAYRDAHTGWFFAQNLSADTSSYTYDGMQKLFKFVGINGHGEWLQNNIKISITNIKASKNENVPYGTFDVVVRRASDSDIRPVVLERFSACDLDPSSPNYIGIKVGDVYQVWDDTEKRYREYGSYSNRSQYIRVVMNETVDNGGASAAFLPFGVYGPPRFPSWTFFSGSTSYAGHPSTTAYALGGNLITNVPAVANASQALSTVGLFGTASIEYPKVGARTNCTSDGVNPTTNAYFGLQTGKSSTSTVHDPGYGDYLKAFGYTVVADSDWGDSFGDGTLPGNLVNQWVFTLDEVSGTVGAGWSSTTPTDNITEATWTAGSHATGLSWTATSTHMGTTSYKNVLDSKINRFTSPMFGGFDGLDVTQADPFRNTYTEGGAETTNYAYYTLRRAIDTIADAEVVEMNTACIPGVTNEAITKYLLDTVESRADALAIIDVKGGFQPRHESNSSISSRQGNLASVLSNMEARNLNTSYGCAYYPWVKVRDESTGTFLNMPPSVVALGVMANTERAADVWFAPAGFTRGGLSTGAGGLAVTGVETKLTSANRDDLYELNINPIASFPAEGVVIYGQKTLQATQSALDRINVRRLMIFVKRGISGIASSTIFQPNVQATWNSFKGRADRFLGGVKVGFGVDDFRVVLDETTTTADLVDRNIMYAKIFIKPTRAAEFIAIDFMIMRSGASFED